MRLLPFVCALIIAIFTYSSGFSVEKKSAIPDPDTSSPRTPVKQIPKECRNGVVEAYITALKSGETNFKKIQPLAGTGAAADCLTMNKKGQVISQKECDPGKSQVGYVWKELADSPTVIGITDGMMSDHEPHYHSQDECYYVVSGEGKTLAQDRFVTLSQGHYFFIPGNSIHNTPITSKDGLSVMYWYPGSAVFSTFRYYYRHNTRSSSEAIKDFNAVDRIRKSELSLNPYGDKLNLDKIRAMSEKGL